MSDKRAIRCLDGAVYHLLIGKCWCQQDLEDLSALRYLDDESRRMFWSLPFDRTHRALRRGEAALRDNALACIRAEFGLDAEER